MRLIAVSLVLAATALGSAGAQTTDRSVMLASVFEGRRVIEQVFTAVGGRAALRSVKTIESEETIRQVNARQAVRPGVPVPVFGRRLLSLDVVGQRFAEQRLLDITGGQLWDVGRVITPQQRSPRDSAPAALQPLARLGQPLTREVRRLVAGGGCSSGIRRSRHTWGGRLLASEQPHVEELVELLA